jgi:hypothetical protein
VGEDVLSDTERAALDSLKGDPLRGVHAFYAASEREWWAPLRPAVRVLRKNALVAVLDKESSFGGRAVHEWTSQVFAAADGTMLAAQSRMMLRTEREQATERKKYADLEPQTWTSEALAEVDEQYGAEGPLGAEPRWFEDVSEGDELTPLVKGPLTVTDMICWHVGMGMGLYGVAPLRLGWKNRQRVPRFYHPDDLGIADVMQRVHWDPEFARRSGNPTTFDYGRMRETWLVHACTDWMGDDGWLWKLRAEFRQFNYVGDLQRIGGRVVRAYLAEGDRPAVDLELWAVNHRGVTTTPGTATVLLPSLVHGPVRLPEPPSGAVDLDTGLDALVHAFGRR